VPGGAGVRRVLQQHVVLDWLSLNAHSAEIVASICTGAFLLGKLGFFDRLYVTTHHSCLDELRSIAPAAIVEPSKRFHDNGKFCAAAGISSGIDLSLHLIKRLVSADAATATARYMEYDAGRVA
jgi:transcriptional regulator GlxA family with amidase domain